MIHVCYMVDAPYAGGAERYVALLAESLDRSRFVPSVVARSGDGLDEWCNDLRARGIAVSRVRMNLPYRPGDLLGIVRALASHRPHLVHVNMPGPYDGQMGLLAPVARFAGAGAVVVTEHLPMVGRLWKRALVKAVAYHWVDRVLTICDDNVPYLKGLQNVPDERIEVIYNGLPGDFGSGRERLRRRARAGLGLDDETVAVGFVGALVEHKGGGVLIEAAAGIEEGPWQLIVVGDGEQRSGLEESARSLGITGGVRFLGQRSAAEVEEILCALDLLAAPSFVEGMPYVILEAMACSLPVVASAVNGIPEAVVDGKTALLVPPGDVGALRGGLARLVREPETRRRMGERGRDRFERLFTVQRQVASVQRSYLELLGARDHGRTR
ncbi:MAG: glycosyltransferase family 4 protein [Candidatus Krumholzibacteriia bacterium]